MERRNGTLCVFRVTTELETTFSVRFDLRLYHVGQQGKYI
jgi:hypothetical protein